jgi:hypothetical protein
VTFSRAPADVASAAGRSAVRGAGRAARPASRERAPADVPFPSLRRLAAFGVANAGNPSQGVASGCPPSDVLASSANAGSGYQAKSVTIPMRAIARP